MMRRFLSGLLVCLCLLGVSGIVHAERLDEEQARLAVVSFFNNSTDRGLRRVKAKQLQLLPVQRKCGCYIFNREDGGTVFVADDDAIGYTVLGYTDGGSFNPDSIPVGLQDWLDQIGVLMKAVHEGKIDQRYKLQTRAGNVVVKPLIQTKWNQESPYNGLTPTIYGKHCVTGCVATAVAQVLNYWKWPERSLGYGAYTLNDGSDKEYEVAIDTQYDWDNMLDTYSGDYDEKQANAVAELMRDCGYAAHMNYGLGESGGWMGFKQLSTVFGFQGFAQLTHEDFSEDIWHKLIKKDLTEGRPILYSGWSNSSGHSYLVDGYRSDQYLHVNWGWGGYADGWFVTSDMQGYNQNQIMLHGLEPNRGANSFAYTLEDGVLTITGKGMMPEEYTMENAPWRDRCKEIKKIVIGEGITSVVDFFGYCWSDYVFYGFSNLEELSLPEGLTYLGGYSFTNAPIEHVELPTSLMMLNYAFNNCNQLKVLHLGPNVIDYKNDRDSKTKVEIDEDNPYMTIRDNIIYSKDGTWLKERLTAYPVLTIPEEVKFVSSSAIYDLNLVISRPRHAPQIIGGSIWGNWQGVIIVPRDATGYDIWQKSVYPNHKILYCSDMDRAKPNLEWSLNDYEFSLKGLGVISENDEMFDIPYYYDVQKIDVGEGIVYLDWGALYSFYSASEVTLPSTLQAIDGYSLPHNVSTITCTATKAPVIMQTVPIWNQYGTLRVPIGATGYEAWFEKMLPSTWKIEYFTPVPQVAYKLPGDDAEHGACSLDTWEAVLKDYPNTVGVLRGDFELLPYLAQNIAYADAETKSGYLCPYFKLTDLTYGYETTEKAPQTGFNPIVSFDVLKGSYKRQLYKGNNSICLPFDVTADDLPPYFSLYTYSHFNSEDEDAIFTSAQMVDAAQPCYIVLQDDRGWTKKLDGQTISNSYPSETGAFCGTYVSTSLFKDRGYAPRSSDNYFAPLADQLHPFRACFILDSPANVHLQLVDDEETDISSVRTQGTDAVYRIDGVRVSDNHQHGIYIVNSKKVIR